MVLNGTRDHHPSRLNYINLVSGKLWTVISIDNQETLTRAGSLEELFYGAHVLQSCGKFISSHAPKRLIRLSYQTEKGGETTRVVGSAMA